jgi:hypothetical protein
LARAIQTANIGIGTIKGMHPAGAAQETKTFLEERAP